MDQLFTKAVTLTDVHFGRNSNSPVANQDNLDFIDWFIDEAKVFGADTCINMGDWHDNRHSLHVSTMDYSLRGMEKLNAAFKKVYWITGNHDLLYRDRRDVTSVGFAQHLTNLEVVREPLIIGGVTILPWLVQGEHTRMKKYMKSRYIFAHLELPGYMMNARVPMPHAADGISSDDLTGPDYVFTGHFHFRQARDNIVYTGNIMPFNFADVDDADRGMMLLEWGKDPEFKAWPEQPLYRQMLLSEMLNQPDKKLCSKLTARVTLDIDITFEEAQVVRDEFIGKYGLRKIELIHQAKASLDQEFGRDVIFQSVDQIVIDGLMSVNSNAVAPEKLVEIYRSLGGTLA